jgi:hypothetical protein
MNDIREIAAATGLTFDQAKTVVCQWIDFAHVLIEKNQPESEQIRSLGEWTRHLAATIGITRHQVKTIIHLWTDAMQPLIEDCRDGWSLCGNDRN